ncbi:MAG TPA: glycosyltransferase family 2 protein [Steroidobacteraceae bacterium]|nr:glycosyltransferase family 2 protein [Steroidobacteraceae bacterium]
MGANKNDPGTPVPEASIVIGTLDRCELLGRAIRSILEQGCDPRRYEIVVVDNGSKDRTRQVVEEISAGANNVRYVVEPRLGLSIARNRGIAESRAPIIGFFDDDGTAEPGWLVKMLELFRQEPDIGAAGGLIRVAWPGSQPEWMPMDLQGYYAGCDYGATRRYLDFPQYPYGPNMMIRRSLLDAIGGFNESVGPKGQNIMSAGELDLFQRLYERPIKVVYEPTAVVNHWVPAERATRKWLLHRAYKHGFSSTRTKTVSVGRTRLAWLKLMVRALLRSGMACVAGALGAAGRAGKPVVTSRYAHMSYWGGVARGSLDGVLHGATLAPAPR